MRGSSLVSDVRLLWRLGRPAPTKCQLSPGHVCGLPEFPLERPALTLPLARGLTPSRLLPRARTLLSNRMQSCCPPLRWVEKGHMPFAQGTLMHMTFLLHICYRLGSRKPALRGWFARRGGSRSGQRRTAGCHADPRTAGALEQGRPSELSCPSSPMDRSLGGGQTHKAGILQLR